MDERKDFITADRLLCLFWIMITFCTYFDKNYLDKGLVLYRSLKRNCACFKLYIFCFDHITYEVLKTLRMDQAVLVKWSEYETEELLKRKRERTGAEYCWTCTPQIIKCVLEKYGENHCIYIDADMAFFSDPSVLLDEIIDTGCHIGIIEHRFNPGFFGRRYLRRSGRYCVEFNYFDRTKESMRALNWWAEKCMEWCFHIYEPEKMGDQKYLEKFPAMFEGVHVFQHQGAGMAPWNSRQYRACIDHTGRVLLRNKRKKTNAVLIFYHFQNMRYITPGIMNIGSGTNDREIKKTIYYPYLHAVAACRNMLKRRGIEFEDSTVSSSDHIMALWQKYLIRFKVKSVSDIIDINKAVRYVKEKGMEHMLW